MFPTMVGLPIASSDVHATGRTNVDNFDDSTGTTIRLGIERPRDPGCVGELRASLRLEGTALG